MSSTPILVSPSPPTGLQRRIELSGLDLWLLLRIDNVFVYPGEINLDRLTDALSRTLSIWSLVAGQGFQENDRYFIIMSDHSIPVTFVRNEEISSWSLDSTVVVEMMDNPLKNFIDEVQTMKLFDQVSNEPLLRIKLTQLVQSNEWILGMSWAHVLGDADSCLQFSKTLSRFYQQLEPSMPSPIFERRIWFEEENDPSFLPYMKSLHYSKGAAELFKNFLPNQIDYDRVTIHLSGEQIRQIRSMIEDTVISNHDALVAYIILKLNQVLLKNPEHLCLMRTAMTINFRDIAESIASSRSIGNDIVTMVSENFMNPFSLTKIAKTIRQSILKLRNPTFLEPFLATTDKLMRHNVKNDKYPDVRLFKEEIMINSNFRYDWCHDVDFGYNEQCRFFTTWAGYMYIRIFHLNPKKIENSWIARDRNGAEVAFRIEKHLRQDFIDSIERDKEENFMNVSL